ncbi:MAG: hypothetical protein K0S07_1734 [Chlamydiales bacterium]|jgi:hypothetical protein|nr:hypothetical protein [Chlamydiales bacterium]
MVEMPFFNPNLRSYTIKDASFPFETEVLVDEREGFKKIEVRKVSPRNEGLWRAVDLCKAALLYLPAQLAQPFTQAEWTALPAQYWQNRQVEALGSLALPEKSSLKENTLEKALETAEKINHLHHLEPLFKQILEVEQQLAKAPARLLVASAYYQKALELDQIGIDRGSCLFWLKKAIEYGSEEALEHLAGYAIQIPEEATPRRAIFEELIASGRLQRKLKVRALIHLSCFENMALWQETPNLPLLGQRINRLNTAFQLARELPEERGQIKLLLGATYLMGSQEQRQKGVKILKDVYEAKGAFDLIKAEAALRLAAAGKLKEESMGYLLSVIEHSASVPLKLLAQYKLYAQSKNSEENRTALKQAAEGPATYPAMRQRILIHLIAHPSPAETEEAIEQYRFAFYKSSLQRQPLNREEQLAERIYYESSDPFFDSVQEGEKEALKESLVHALDALLEGRPALGWPLSKDALQELSLLYQRHRQPNGQEPTDGEDPDALIFAKVQQLLHLDQL